MGTNFDHNGNQNDIIFMIVLKMEHIDLEINKIN